MVPKRAKETLEVVGAFLLFTVQEARQKPIIAKSIYRLESKYFIIFVGGSNNKIWESCFFLEKCTSGAHQVPQTSLVVTPKKNSYN
jgi:hypothetical protein